MVFLTVVFSISRENAIVRYFQKLNLYRFLLNAFFRCLALQPRPFIEVIDAFGVLLILSSELAVDLFIEEILACITQKSGERGLTHAWQAYRHQEKLIQVLIFDQIVKQKIVQLRLKDI